MMHEQDFWAMIDMSGGPHACWTWKGGLTKKGYGQVSFQGKTRRVHRLAWELKHGPIPSTMQVLHRCDNPPCANHEQHLFLGTNQDNIDDQITKGRKLMGEESGRNKLTTQQILEMRELRSHGWLLRQIGEKFQVHLSTVSYVLQGKTWRHLL